MIFSNTSGIAVINNVMIPLQDAQIPLTDRGLLFGHAVFETCLVLKDNILEWKAHYTRLQASCAKALLSCPEETQLAQSCLLAISEMLKTNNNCERMNLKILVTGGSDTILSSQSSQAIRSNVYILCQKASNLTVAERLKGFTLKSFLDMRSAFLIGIKSTNYIFQFLCLEEAKKTGFDDAIFINHVGEYTEGVTSSFLWFDNQYCVFSTPPTGNCLKGTSILRLERELRSAKRPFYYRSLDKNDTTNCAGCALVSSVRGIIPIKQIDNHFFDIEPHSTFFKYLIELCNV